MKRRIMGLLGVVTLVLASSLMMFLPLTSAEPIEELSVSTYTLVSKARVGRTMFDYTYEVTATNASEQEIKNITGSVTATSTAITIMSPPNLAFADVAGAGTTQATTNLVLRLDRRTTFDRNNLLWEFEGEMGRPPSEPIIIPDPNFGAHAVNLPMLKLVEGTNLSDAENITATVGGTVVKSLDFGNIYLIEISARTSAEFLSTLEVLEDHHKVVSVIPNYPLYLQSENTDIEALGKSNPSFTSAYKKIKVIEAWRLLETDPNIVGDITIGILDSGIDAGHPEFKGITIEGDLKDTGATNSCRVITSHGTPVAGIIAANNKSAVLRSPFDMNGITTGIPSGESSRKLNIQSANLALLSDNFTALNKIAPKVSVINMSLGDTRCDNLDRESCAFKKMGCIAKSKIGDKDKYKDMKAEYSDIFSKFPNTIFVVAAMNSNVPAIDALPAALSLSHDNVITVGATNINDAKASFSNFGIGIDIAAPGEGATPRSGIIYAPRNRTDFPSLGFDDYWCNTQECQRVPEENFAYDPITEMLKPFPSKNDFFMGTSGAAPMVASVVGLMKAIDPELTPSDVKEILRVTGDKTDPDADGRFLGNDVRRLNAMKAVACVMNRIDALYLDGVTGLSAVDMEALRQLVTINPQCNPSASIAFIDLDNGNRREGGVQAMTDDGGAVIWNSPNFKGLRWLRGGNRHTVLAPFGLLYDMSSDGDYIVGQNSGEATLWDQKETDPQALGALVQDRRSGATGVSRDGKTVVGVGEISDRFVRVGRLETHAFRWTKSGGIEDLGTIEDDERSGTAAVAVSADGRAIAGNGYFSDGIDALLWKSNSWKVLDRLPDSRLCEATNISANGKTIIGSCLGPIGSGTEAVMWNDTGRATPLGFLQSGRDSVAYASSDDGSVIVGQSRDSGGNIHAFIWDIVNGMRKLSDILIQRGVDLTGIRLLDAKAVSDDGLNIAGNSGNGGYLSTFHPPRNSP